MVNKQKRKIKYSKWQIEELGYFHSSIREITNIYFSSKRYFAIIKDLAKRSYLNYIQKSRKIIEFKWDFIQNLGIILGNLLLVAIRYINPSLLGTNPELKPTWFSLIIIVVFGFNWYFSNHFTQKKMDAEKAQFFTKVNEQYQKLL